MISFLESPWLAALMWLLESLGIAILFAAAVGVLLAVLIWLAGRLLYPRPVEWDEVDIYDDGRWGGHP